MTPSDGLSPYLPSPPAGPPSADRPIRIVVVEDESLIRDALTTLLGLEPDLEVHASIERGDAALEWLRANEVDVAVLDNDLPGLSGLEVAEQLSAEGRMPAVIVVSGKAGPEDLRRAVRLQIRGFCTKGVSGSDLAQAIRSVHAGHRYLDPDLSALALAAEENPLRDREIDVLRLVAQGLGTADIAARLSLTRGTVRNYVSSACTKLHAANKIAAVRRAHQAGWL